MNGPVPTMLDMLIEIALRRPNFLGSTTVTDFAGSPDETERPEVGMQLRFNLNHLGGLQQNS
jgi:hypothetical protein